MLINIGEAPQKVTARIDPGLRGDVLRAGDKRATLKRMDAIGERKSLRVSQRGIRWWKFSRWKW
jgi:hypothetical protein